MGFKRLAILFAVMGISLTWSSGYVAFRLGLPSTWISKLALLPAIPALLFAPKALTKKGFWRSGPLLAMAALFAVGVLWTDPTEIKRAYSYTTAFVLSIALAAVIGEKYLRFAMAVFCWTTVASTLWFFTQPMADRWGAVMGEMGRITNPDQVGHQMTLALILLAVQWTHGMSRTRKCLTGAAIFLLFIAAVMTASRTAILALLGVGCVVSLVIASRKAANVIVVIVWIGMMGAGLVLLDGLVSEEPFYAQALERFQAHDTSSLGSRTDVWSVAAEAFLMEDHWRHGSGTGGVEKYLGQWPARQRDYGSDHIMRLYPHNMGVWIALAFGVPGMVIGGVFTLIVFRRAFRLDFHEKDWRRIAILTCMALIGWSCAIVMEPYFAAVGAILWAMLTPASAGSRPRLWLSQSPYGQAVERQTA